jgi:hypothetical protein
MACPTFENIGVMTGIAVVYASRHPVCPVAVETIRFSQVRIVGVCHIPVFVCTGLAVLCQLDQLFITAVAFKTESLGIFFCLSPDNALLAGIFVLVSQIPHIVTGQAIFSRTGVSIGQHAFPCHRSGLKHVTCATGLLFVPNGLPRFFIGTLLGKSRR